MVRTGGLHSRLGSIEVKVGNISHVRSTRLHGMFVGGVFWDRGRRITMLAPSINGIGNEVQIVPSGYRALVLLIGVIRGVSGTIPGLPWRVTATQLSEVSVCIILVVPVSVKRGMIFGLLTVRGMRIVSGSVRVHGGHRKVYGRTVLMVVSFNRLVHVLTIASKVRLVSGDVVSSSITRGVSLIALWKGFWVMSGLVINRISSSAAFTPESRLLWGVLGNVKVTLGSASVSSVVLSVIHELCGDIRSICWIEVVGFRNPIVSIGGIGQRMFQGTILVSSDMVREDSILHL